MIKMKMEGVPHLFPKEVDFVDSMAAGISLLNSYGEYRRDLRDTYPD
jgi:hypothetical protein